MINFVKYKNICFVVALLFIAAGVWGYNKHNGFAYGVDFVGGTELRVVFDSAIDISLLREAVNQEEAGFQSASIQSVDGDRQFIVKVGQTTQDVQDRFEKVIAKNFTTPFQIRSVEQVGPEAGKEVRWNTVLSIFVVLFALLLYISIRHRYDYAIGAVVALAHDPLALLCIYLVFNVPLTLNILAAVLAAIGYSLNDTIIVFSRIKDNVIKLKGLAKEEIVNISINQTLRRTLLTSFATFISMLSLFIFGGEVLRDFSLTMMIGIVVGTYSSIYVASPVMLLLSSKNNL
jgi:preprotein translocase subunit SecF